MLLQSKKTSKSYFNFSFIEKVDIMKQVKMFQSNKATQNVDISNKLIKDNADIFREFVFTSLNSELNSLFSRRN